MDNRTRNGIGVILILVVTVSVLAVSLLSMPDPRQQALETLDANIIEVMSNTHIPGVAACAVKDGEIQWMKTYGYADMDLNVSVTNDTLFMLGSVSKIVTGLAFMQLFEDGLVGLDDNISDYLPFEVVHPQHPNYTITPRMLLSHVSGIRDNWLELGPLETSGSDSPISLEDFTRGYLLTNGTYYQTSNYNSAEPGTVYEYTNVGSTLIAYLVEVISNETFEDYCQENIFVPLGMTETSWFLANLGTSSIAIPYVYTGSTHQALDHYGSPVYPCGFVRTSIHQQATFMTMLMNGGVIGETRIINSSTLQLMMTHHYPELAPNYGFFFQHSDILWGHGGSGPGVATRTFFYPEAKEGVVIMLNLEDTTALNSIHNHILNGMRSAFGWLT